MDKDNLPKLKIEGFTNVERQPKRALWKNRAADIAQRFSINRNAKKPEETAKQAKHHDGDAGYKRLLIKTGVCAAIAIVILAISSINTPTANNITQAIEQTVNHEFDIEEDIGRLKFVKSLEEELQNVFSPTEQSVL